MEDYIRELIQNYTPSSEVAALVEDTHVVLLCGITGAGKDTVQTELLKREHLTSIVTSTTRAPRENDGVMEQHGREYYFFTTEQAVENIKNKRYFEVAVVHERINGVTAEEIQRIHDTGQTAVANIDFQGVEYFKKYSPSTIAIFIVPPSFDVWMERLKRRYDTEQDFQAAWPARRDSALRELDWALSSGHCSIIVNDDLAEAVETTDAIIHGDPAPDDGRAVAQSIYDKLKAGDESTGTHID